VRSVAVEPGNKWFATGAGDRVIKVRFWGASLAFFSFGKRVIGRGLLAHGLFVVDMGPCER
jgi:hypothetical protein